MVKGVDISMVIVGGSLFGADIGLRVKLYIFVIYLPHIYHIKQDLDNIEIGDKSDFFPAITRASRMLMGNDEEQPGHLGQFSRLQIG